MGVKVTLQNRRPESKNQTQFQKSASQNLQLSGQNQLQMGSIQNQLKTIQSLKRIALLVLFQNLLKMSLKLIFPE